MTAPTTDTPAPKDVQVPEGFVALVVSNPLSERDTTRLRAHRARDVKAGDTLVIPLDMAETFIQSGYAAVDPTNRPAIRELLGLNDADQPLTTEERIEKLKAQTEALRKETEARRALAEAQADAAKAVAEAEADAAKALQEAQAAAQEVADTAPTGTPNVPSTTTTPDGTPPVDPGTRAAGKRTPS